MSTTLLCLTPDIDGARALVKNLKEHDIDDKRLHIVARSDISLEELPEADLSHESDVVHAAKRGSIAGASVGALAGITMVAFPPAGLALGGGALAAAGAVAGTSLGGAAFGTWASTMVGVSIPNSDYQGFQNAIDDGKILLMVDAEDAPHAQQLKQVLENTTDQALESIQIGRAA